MTTPAAGWYPDPAGSGGRRWWTGSSWGDQVQPAPQPVVQPWHVGQQYGAGQPQAPGQVPAQQWGAGQPDRQAPAGFARKNTVSLAVLGIALLYAVLATTVHIVVLGFLPLFLGVNAVKRKEPLAWPAVGAGAAVLIFTLENSF